MPINLSSLSQLHTISIDILSSTDTIQLNNQTYNISLSQTACVSKDYGQNNRFQTLCRNTADFFQRLTTQDQQACLPRAAQMQNILQEKLRLQQEQLQLEQNKQYNQGLNIANINIGRVFLSALTKYKGDIMLEDAIAFKQAYRNIQLDHKGDNEMYGITLVATAFNNGHFSENQYQRLCELTHVASAHGKLSHELKDATELSQTDFISLQGLAADSIAIQRAALQFNTEPLALINTIRHFGTKDEQRAFDKSDMGKQIINESSLLKKTNERICNKLAWETLEKR